MLKNKRKLSSMQSEFLVIRGNLGLMQFKISRFYSILMYDGFTKLVPYISRGAVRGRSNFLFFFFFLHLSGINKERKIHVSYEVFTSESILIMAFWDVTRSSLVERCIHFRGTGLSPSSE